MMSSLAFDSLRFARRLKAAGVPDTQAEAQAELMAEAFGFYVDNLVTRDYLDTRLAEQDARIEKRFSEQDARIEKRFSEQDAKIEQRFSEQDAKIEQRFSEQDVRLEARFARQELYMEKRLSGLDVKLNVMAAILAIIAASVVPLAISTLVAA